MTARGFTRTSYDVHMIINNALFSNAFKVEAFTGVLTSQLENVNRYVNLTDVAFDGIISSTIAWDKEQTHSYFGFQPFPAISSTFYKYNFMYYLTRTAKVIDSNVISFNLREEYGHSSYVKFGGYDTVAFENNDISSMGLFKTKSYIYWHLIMSNMSYKNRNGGYTKI